MRPVILLLHGWTMRGAIWDDLIARLGPQFDCLAPDLPGHASAADQPPTLAACARTIAGCLDTRPGQQALIVGWSMGAAAAWRYVAENGTSRLAGLMTVDMTPKIEPSGAWAHGLMGQTTASVASSTLRFANDWDGATHGIAATMFATKDGPAAFSRSRAHQIIRSHDPEKMRALWADMLAMDARPQIGAINVPYLVCSGARSRVYPASASDWIAEQAPDARRHVFTNSGHSPHLEEPEAFAQTIAEFVQTLGA